MTVYQFALDVGVVAVALSILMAGAWLAWRISRNSGWVDATWTFGLGAICCLGALVSFSRSHPTSRQVVVAVLVAFWSLRLGAHIAYRTTQIADDPRYAKLLRGWGAAAPRQMFWLLQKQAVVSIPMAISVILAARNPSPALRVQDLLGVLILFVAIIGETIADTQLRRFRNDPRNRDRVCDVSLWRWSRHPNYFFEWVGWLAYPLFAVDVSGAYPWGWVAIAGPVCMYWLLVHISGIPPLEEHMLERRHDAFRSYQANTSAFFPAPPRAN
jgi:steroid 5-alpha reductase family enzyme